MDKIYINDMMFYGYHGVLVEENKIGQRFKVDIIVDVDLKKAGQTDDLSNTINYQELYNITQNIVEGPPFNLIEAVGEKIASVFLDTFPQIINCRIKVIKPDPPIPGYYNSVAIEINRGR